MPATPLDMKAEADMHFLQGINQLIGHGWPYTPETVAYPGWRFYAAAVFDEKNPWWIVMPDLIRYLQRRQFPDDAAGETRERCGVVHAE